MDDKVAKQSASADPYHWVAWANTNRKLLTQVAAAVLVLGVIIGFYTWHKSSVEAQAEEALSLIKLPDPGTASVVTGADAEPFAKFADDYAGSAAAARALIIAGGIYFEAGKYDDATKMFNRYLAEHADYPLSSQAALGLAACLDAEGKTNDAIAKYEEILRRPPDSTTTQARVALARIFAAQNKPAQAMQMYEDTLRGNSGDSWEAEARILGLQLIGKNPSLGNQPQGPTGNTLEMPKQ